MQRRQRRQRGQHPYQTMQMFRAPPVYCWQMTPTFFFFFSYREKPGRRNLSVTGTRTKDGGQS